MGLLSSLTNRIFLATTVLAVLAIGFAVYLISVRMVSEAEAELRRGLLEAGKLVEQYRMTLVDTLTVEARLIADLPRLKAAVATGDPPTVEPIASDYQARVGSDLFVVTDHTGRVLVAAGVPAPARSPADLPGVTQALAGEESNNFWPLPDGLLHAVTVPIAIGLDSPEILGSLSVGFLFDEELAAEFESLTDSRVVFAMDGRIRGPMVGSANQRALATLLGSTGVTRLMIEGDEYVALVQPLSSAGAATRNASDSTDVPVLAADAAAGSRIPAAIILRSRTERLRFLNEVFATLAGAALLAVVLAIGLSYGVARTVTRPLAAITAAMREMAATGDLTRKIELPRRGRWQDEDASLLATTFNMLTDSIARFQRDAAHRERLSSLGRLSTVIAHEIRNPLMIIKASLRTIRREDVAPAEAREAAADIDDEVTRLNRVVNDVLDFARPVRFDMAPVDLNALCAECVAATAGEHVPHIHLTADPSLPVVVTDADRLRTALVNVLVNAQQAVVAHANGHDATAPLSAVHLRTARTRTGQIAIVVSDSGGGISVEDLPRVFDPYYTTRRTGTGLGLPIAKNIIEGLGGTIVVETRQGEGTEMRIELPDRPAVP